MKRLFAILSVSLMAFSAMADSYTYRFHSDAEVRLALAGKAPIRPLPQGSITVDGDAVRLCSATFLNIREMGFRVVLHPGPGSFFAWPDEDYFASMVFDLFTHEWTDGAIHSGNVYNADGTGAWFSPSGITQDVDSPPFIHGYWSVEYNP